MPAVVRVKRRIDEEPLSAFVLNGKKRRRLEDGEIVESGTAAVGTAAKDEISTILKFAGTIKEQDDTATTQLARLTKEAARELVQQKTRKSTTSHTERARQEMRQSLHEQRFRVVNCMRTTLEEAEGVAAGADSDDELNANSAKQITIVDIEKQSATAAPATNGAAVANTTPTAATTSTPMATAITPELVQPSDSDTGYVYDLYLPENEEQAAYVDLMDDNYLSVRAFDDLIYEDRYNDSDDEYDSEDSNQENYFANDYPDEDDEAEFQDSDGDESEGTREMRLVVEKFVFGDDDEDAEAADTHSSDDEDINLYQDPYVHMLDFVEMAGSFADDVDYCDADRYGIAYARYKARVLSLQHKDDDDDDKSDEDAHSNSSSERFHSASENEEPYN